MCHRAGQRRHRLAAAGIGGECQVPPAVDLGPPPCAALEQQPDNQQRLDHQCAGGAQNRGPVFAPQARTSITHHAAGRQPTLGDVPSLQLAPVEYRLAGQLRRYPERSAARRSRSRWPRQPCGDRDRRWTSACRRQYRSRDTRCARRTRAHSPWREDRRYPLVRIRGSRRVGAEGEIENRRVRLEGSHSGARSRKEIDRRTRRMSGDREIG